MTIDEALKKGASFISADLRPKHVAELLLAHVLEVAKERLIVDSKHELDDEKWAEFVELLKGYDSGKPLAYLTNYKEFYTLDFYVDERVLIPRPETEMLVDEVLDIVQKKYSKSVRILDVGTGSGNIVISLAKQLEDCEFVASELSEEALEVASENASRHGVGKSIKFVQSDLLEEFAGESFDIIVANLPYIGLEKYNFVSKEAKKFEPNLALFGGVDGLQLYKKMFQQLNKLEVESSYLLGEFGFAQSEDMEKLLSNFFGQNFVIKADLAGIDRVFIVNLQGC